MDKSPLVSILIPTYNRPKGLKKALDTVLEQTYQNLEVIISDNCSSMEEVGMIIERAEKDERIKIYRQKTNLGAINNFNFLNNKFTGTYYMYLADDDCLAKNFVEECVGFLETNLEYSIAFGIVKQLDHSGKLISTEKKGDVSNESFFLRMIHYFWKVELNGAFYGVRRSFKESSLDFRLEKILAHDWFVVNRFLYKGKIKELESTAYYKSFTGVSSASLEKMIEGLDLPVYFKSPHLTIAKHGYDQICKKKIQRITNKYHLRYLFIHNNCSKI